MPGCHCIDRGGRADAGFLKGVQLVGLHAKGGQPWAQG